MKTELTLSVIIPTYRREKVLTETIRTLLPMMSKSGAFTELLIVDQTEQHEASTQMQLTDWDRKGKIRWITLNPPHITRSMNIGVRMAKGYVVLFLDDDIIPAPALVEEHLNAHYNHPDAWAVVGQVLQPWDNPRSVVYTPSGGYLTRYLDFPFFSLEGTFVENVMAGNLSVRRDHFIRLDGFDENFTPPVASRFETEFAKRLVLHGGKIWFEPKASIRHLRAATGGTRSKGNHLTSMSPIHGIGDYYYALKTANGFERMRYMALKPLREVRTKFHFRHPWYIPVKLVGEIRALIRALMIYGTTPKHIAGRRRSDD